MKKLKNIVQITLAALVFAPAFLISYFYAIHLTALALAKALLDEDS